MHYLMLNINCRMSMKIIVKSKDNSILMIMRLLIKKWEIISQGVNKMVPWFFKIQVWT